MSDDHAEGSADCCATSHPSPRPSPTGGEGERVVRHGELVSPRRVWWRGMAWMSPGIGWLVLFLGVPCLLLVLLAFATRGAYGEILFYGEYENGVRRWLWTLDNVKKLAGFGMMGWSADYLWIFGRTIWLALVTTFACVLLAYPMAFFIALRERKWRTFWLVLIMIPFCTNLVIRTYGWELVFSMLPGQWFPSATAVYVGMISSNLSFAVLPLFTSVERLDWSIVEAAKDLYASRWGVFRHGILPQTMPGLVVAIVITFIPCLGMFVVSDLLGGGKYMLVGNLIQQQFGPSRDFPLGAAMSFALIVATLIGLKVYQRRGAEAGMM